MALPPKTPPRFVPTLTEVVQFPDAVQKKFAEASKVILAKETAGGERAGKGSAALTGLMKDLGYA